MLRRFPSAAVIRMSTAATAVATLASIGLTMAADPPAWTAATRGGTSGDIVLESVHQRDGAVRVRRFETARLRGSIATDERGLLVEWGLVTEPGRGFAMRLEPGRGAPEGTGSVVLDLDRHGALTMNLAPDAGAASGSVSGIVNHQALLADELFLETVALSEDLARRAREEVVTGSESEIRFLRVAIGLPVAMMERSALEAGAIVRPLGITPPEGSCADSGPNLGECRDCCARQLSLDSIGCAALGLIPSPLAPLLVVACQALAAYSYQKCLALCDLTFTGPPIFSPVVP